MNYYELIYLKKELKNKLVGGQIIHIHTPFKNQLEAFIEKDGQSFRLIFNVTPGNSALFFDVYRPPKRSNALRFFPVLYEQTITEIVLADKDRLLSLLFESGHVLLFKLFGNKANALLVENEQVIDVFKDHGETGEPAPKGKKTHLFQQPETFKLTKELIVRLNPLWPRSLISDLISANNLKEKSPSEIQTFVEEASRQMANNPKFRKLTNGSATLLNEDFLPLETEKAYPSVNELIADRFKNYAHRQRLTQRKSEYRKLIVRQLKRLESSLKNLRKADKGLEKAEQFEQFGHLLMAKAHLGKVEEKVLTVPNFYDEGKETDIQIQPDLNIVDNAKWYYDRAQSSIKSFEEAEQRMPELVKRKERLERMQSELENVEQMRDVEDWAKKFGKELEALGVGAKKSTEQQLPFHSVKIKEFTCWIGKNARSNDKMVQLAHKEDMWLHARGVPGSHLIIRMNNNKAMPAKSILEKAAGYAAFNSKAKGSALVPVIFTKKKYVRKPKGAAPGAVLVQKEEVLFVEPEKPKP